jgi:hypothetical protein
MLGYLTRLSDRMDTRGMGTEPLADSVRKARSAMQELRMALQYLHCGGLAERANKDQSGHNSLPLRPCYAGVHAWRLIPKQRRPDHPVPVQIPWALQCTGELPS